MQKPWPGDPASGPSESKAGLRLRLLGPIELVGLGRPLGSQELSFVTYLACVGPARREVLIEALWDGQTVSVGRFANLVSGVRRRIGSQHLPPARGGRYGLTGVDVDIDLLGGPELEGLESAHAVATALAGMQGPVMTPPTDRWWSWLDHHPEVVARAEAVVARAAHRLVGALWEAGELARAQIVCERALAASPLDRDLVLALEGLHRAQGRTGAAHRLVERWRLRVKHLEAAS